MTVTDTGISSRMRVMTGDGSDVIHLHGTGHASVIDVDGEADADTIELGAASNALDGIAGETFITGGDIRDDDAHTGSSSLTVRDTTNTLAVGDTLLVHDRAGVSESADVSYEISPTTLTRTGASQVTFDSIETFDLRTSTQQGTLAITGTPDSTSTSIDLGSGTTTVAVATTGVDSNVEIFASDAATTVEIDALGTDSFAVITGGSGAETLIVNSTPETSALQLDGGVGQDAFFGVDLAGLVQMNGGAGSDAFEFGNATRSVGGITGDVRVNGGDHDAGDSGLVIRGVEQRKVIGDSITVNGTADSEGQTWDADSQSFSRSHQTIISHLEGIETLMLLTGTGDDTVDFTSSVENVVVETGAGDDVIDFSGAGNAMLMGGSGADDIDARGQSGAFTFVDAGDGADTVTAMVTDAGTRVQIESGSGDDVVSVIRSSIATVADIATGAGQDHIRIGDLPDPETPAINDFVFGQVFVDAGPHNAGVSRLTAAGETNTVNSGDVLELRDSVSGQTYDLDRGTFTRSSGVSVEFSDVETITLQTGAQATVNLESTADGSSVSIATSAATSDDQINIGETGDSSNLSVTTGAGSDQVAVSDIGEEAFFSLSTGSGTDSVTLSGRDAGSRITLDTGGDVDAVTVLETGFSSLTEIVGGGASDAIRIGNAMTPMDGVLGDILIAAEGDHLTVDNSLSATDRTWTLSNGVIRHSSDRLISHTGAQSVSIIGGDGIDHFEVRSVASRQPLLVETAMMSSTSRQTPRPISATPMGLKKH